MVCVYDVPLLAYSHPLILGCSRDTWERWTSAGKGFRMRYNFACKQTFLAKHPVIGLWNRNTNDVLANLSIFDTENQKWWMMVRNEKSLPLSQHRYVQLQICLLSPVEADELKVKWILFLIYRIYNASTGGRAQQLIRELVLTGCHNTDTLKPILISCIIIAAQRTSSEIISKHQQLRTGEKKRRANAVPVLASPFTHFCNIYVLGSRPPGPSHAQSAWCAVDPSPKAASRNCARVRTLILFTFNYLCCCSGATMLG